MLSLGRRWEICLFSPRCFSKGAEAGWGGLGEAKGSELGVNCGWDFTANSLHRCGEIKVARLWVDRLLRRNCNLTVTPPDSIAAFCFLKRRFESEGVAGMTFEPASDSAFAPPDGRGSSSDTSRIVKGGSP